MVMVSMSNGGKVCTPVSSRWRTCAIDTLRVFPADVCVVNIRRTVLHVLVLIQWTVELFFFLHSSCFDMKKQVRAGVSDDISEGSVPFRRIRVSAASQHEQHQGPGSVNGIKNTWALSAISRQNVCCEKAPRASFWFSIMESKTWTP